MAQNNISVTLQQLDSNGEHLARRVFSVSEDSPLVGAFRVGVLPDTNQATISLPCTYVQQLLFRNTHATAKVTVVWTPSGGAEATVNKVGPNGVIILWDPTAQATGIGITSLKLTADTVNTTYELFLGGTNS